MKIYIKGGRMRFIYKDEFQDLLESGKSSVSRASHVEPVIMDCKVMWEADLSLVGGPKLPPFSLREEALKAEVSWLEENGIPFPEEVS